MADGSSNPYDSLIAGATPTPTPSKANPYDALVSDQHTAAVKLAGTDGVAPSAATSAMQHAPALGLDPSVGMRAAADVASRATQQQALDLAQQSPHINSWVNAASPAQVAATKEDFPSLHSVGQRLTDWLKVGGPLNDIYNAGKGAIEDLGAAVQEGMASDHRNPIESFGNTFRIGRDLLGVPGSVFAAATEPLARGFAAVPLPAQVSGPSLLHPLAPIVTTTDPAQKLAIGRQAAGTALFGLGGEGAFEQLGKARIVGEGGATAAAGGGPKLLGGPQATAEADVAHVAAVQSALAESSTLKASPSTAAAFVEHSAPGAVAHVSPDTLLDLEAQGHAPFPDLAPQIASAALDGSDVEVPLGQYLTASAGQPFADALNAGTSFRTGSPSVEEAEAIPSAATLDAGVPSTVELPADATPAEASRIQNLAMAYEGARAALEKEHYLQPLAVDAKTLGMTKDQFARYGEAVGASVQAATDRLAKRASAEIMRERKPEFQNAVAQHSATVEQEVAQHPGINAWSYLTRGKSALGAPVETPFKLASGDQLSAHAKDLGLPEKMFSRKGLSPDEAAEVFGYPSGADLIRGLQEVRENMEMQGATNTKEHIAALVKQHAEERARTELGYDITPESIRVAALEAVHGPEVTDFLEQELAKFAEVVGVPLKLPVLKAYAERRFEALQVKAALNIKQLEKYVYRGGIKAEKALLKGDAPLAFLRKQQQFVHHLMLEEAFAFAKQFARVDKTMRRVAAKPLAPSGMNQQAHNYLRAIAAELGYATKTKNFEGVLSALNGQSLESYIGSLDQYGVPFVPVPPVASPKSLTVEQFNDISAMFKGIQTVGKEVGVVRLGEEKIAMEDFRASVREVAKARSRQYSAAQLRKIKLDLDAAPRAIGAASTRPETPLFFLDGRTNGPFMRAIINPIQAGKHFSVDRNLAVSKSWNEFMAAQPKGWVGSLKTSVSLPELTFGADADGAPIPWVQTRHQMVGLASYLGTAEGIGKIEKGFGWDIATVQDALNREMTKADWDYAQHILDTFRDFVPDIQRLSKAVNGLGLRLREALPIETPFGTYPGGYRHISYDRSAVGEFKDQEGNPHVVQDPTALKSSEVWGHNYQTSTPAKSYTKQTTGFSAPLNIDLTSIRGDIQQVIHDLAFRQPIIQAVKVLKEPVVRQAISDILGPEYLSMLNKWVQDVARNGAEDGAQVHWMANMLRGLRRNFVTYQIGFFAKTLVRHGGIALSHIGGEVGIPEFARAVGDLWKSPESREEWGAFVRKYSGEVRAAASTIDRDVQDLIRMEFEKRGAVDLARYYSFKMFGIVKEAEAEATWLAKYRNLTEKEGLAHGDAVALSDKAVRDTQGAGHITDLPALWRTGSGVGGEAFKLLNVFTGFENVTTNRAWLMNRVGHDTFRGFKDNGWQGSKRDIGWILASSMAFFIVPSLFGAVIDEGLDTKHKGFLFHFKEALVKSTVGGTLPIVGAAITDLMYAWEKGEVGAATVIDSVLGDLGKTINDSKNFIEKKHVSPKWLEHTSATVGQIAGLPSKVAGTAAQYAWDIDHGRARFTIPNALRILVGGQPSKGN